jgi:hypothetical protein
VADLIVRHTQQTPCGTETIPYSIESHLAGQATIPVLEKLPSLFHYERGRSRLHGCEDRGDALATTDAHGDKRILASNAAEFVQGFYRQDAARCTDGVSK